MPSVVRERARVLGDAATSRVAAPVGEWLARVLPSEDVAFDRGAFFTAYAGAGRRFASDAPLVGTVRERLQDADVSAPDAWSASDLARGALLLAAMAVTPEAEHVGIAREAFRRGDNAERVAVLRALPLFPAPERFADLAAEACRTHVQVVFEAIACENPFPARCFPEANFNQVVLKVLFTEVALERVVGWRERNNPELRRMVADYAAERRAAGRTVPAGVAMISAGAEG